MKVDGALDSHGPAVSSPSVALLRANRIERGGSTGPPLSIAISDCYAVIVCVASMFPFVSTARYAIVLPVATVTGPM